MNKTDMLERLALLSHALLELPENVEVLRIDVDETCGNIIQLYGSGGNVPEEDDHEFDDANGFIRHYRDMGNGIKLLWLTALVTGDCSTCGKDVTVCNNECGRCAE